MEKNNINNQRIEVCGGIASGKTTFAALMSCIGVKTLFENFRTNPFWEAFYTNPGKYIFETEVSFMLQHYHQIKKDHGANRINICDFSFLLDIAYAEVGLQGSQLEAFMTVYQEVERELPPPILLIHLECDAGTELERIRRRDRSVENSITIEFLDSLNRAVKLQVERAREKINILTVNSAQKNFAEDEEVKEEIINLISKHLDLLGVPLHEPLKSSKNQH